MNLYNAKIETHPDGSGDLNAIINGNWRNIGNYISPTTGLVAAQAGTTVTTSADIFTADDAGATIRFADGTTRLIDTVTAPDEVEVTVSGTVTSQEFELYRTDLENRDALMRGLTKRVRMLSDDDGKLWLWDQTEMKLVPVTVFIIDQDAGSVTVADDTNFVFGTANGTQHGTAVNQKQAFWGKTPIGQPASANQAALSLDGDVTGADTVDKAAIDSNFAAIQTLVNQLRTDLVAVGIIKGSA